jgi:lipopolysaccharide transport system permease protein
MSAPGHSSPFADLARKRDLWWQFTVRTVESRYRGSYLGIIWSVFNPLLMLGVFYTVFGIIFKGRFGVLPNENAVDYAMAMFLGLTLFQLVADTLGSSPLTITGNPNLVKKVVFPLEILPLAQVGGLWFNLVVGLSLVIVGSVVFGRGLSLSGLAWLPVIVAPLLLLSAGLGWLLAALGVFFRDLAQAMAFVGQVVLYSSAVFYPVSRITSPAVWAILRWNPFLRTVVLAREVVLWGVPISFDKLLYTYAVGAAVFLLGRWVFHKLQPAFADVL